MEDHLMEIDHEKDDGNQSESSFSFGSETESLVCLCDIDAYTSDNIGSSIGGDISGKFESTNVEDSIGDNYFFGTLLEPSPSTSELPSDASSTILTDIFVQHLSRVKKGTSVVDDKLPSLAPHHVFSIIVTDEIMDMIVMETNKCAQNFVSDSSLTKRSRVKSWIPTCRSEVRKFLGIVMYMELVKKPELHLYWSRKDIYFNSFVPKCITRDRFQLLLKFLQFSDSLPRFEDDRLYKLQSLLDRLVLNYQTLCDPGSTLVIDEYVIPYGGKRTVKQLIGNKFHKYGCKFYKLCTPDSYTWNLLIYVGNSVNIPPFNHSDSVVIKLTENLHDKGYSIYSDHFYSSATLSEFLSEKNTSFMGIQPKNSKKHSKKQYLQEPNQGESSCQNENISSGLEEAVVDCNLSGRLTEKERNLKPQPLIDYYQSKNAIDMLGHSSLYHTALRKTQKWYRNVAIELLTGISVVNAWVLFNKISSPKMPFLQFKESLVQYMMTGSDLGSIEEEECFSLQEPVESMHILQAVPGPKGKTRKRCRMCYDAIASTEGSKKARISAKRVNTYCSSCEGNPFLCLQCFNIKHSTNNS